MLTTNHLRSTIRTSGALPPDLLYALMACPGKILALFICLRTFPNPLPFHCGCNDASISAPVLRRHSLPTHNPSLTACHAVIASLQSIQILQCGHHNKHQTTSEQRAAGYEFRLQTARYIPETVEALLGLT